MNWAIWLYILAAFAMGIAVGLGWGWAIGTKLERRAKGHDPAQ